MLAPRTASMKPDTLRAICIKYTYHYLMCGKWEDCQNNPFSYMPPSIVQDLLSRVLRPDLVTRNRIVRSHLLVTSGRLQHLDLFHSRDNGDYLPLFRMLSRGCRSLQSLSLPRCHRGLTVIPGSKEDRCLRQFFQNCTNLEELHSSFLFDPRYLRNCAKLRRLKLHLNRSEALEFSRKLSPALLQRLGCIQVFALCQIIHLVTACQKDGFLSLTVMLLDNCPELTSMGFLDSSMAIKELSDRDLRTYQPPRTFQLRRCYWAPERDLGQLKICESIRVAVSSCPWLEVLVMEVHMADYLRHLTNSGLKNLTILHLDFHLCKDEYEQEFFSLLNKVGPQLRGLSVTGSLQKLHNLSLISDSCPVLTSLQLHCGITAGVPAQPHGIFLHLKHLSVLKCDRECVLFLLSNCVHLKVLCLNQCRTLDDGLLYEILQKNSLTELEVAYINSFSLSKAGLITFVLSAKNLKKFSFDFTFLIDHFEGMQNLSDINRPVKFVDSYGCAELGKEEFPQNCWL